MVLHRHQISVLNVMATTIIVFSIVFLCSTGTKIYYLIAMATTIAVLLFVLQQHNAMAKTIAFIIICAPQAPNLLF